MNLLPKKYVSFASMLVEEIESEFGRNKVNEILGKVADKIVSESGWTKADGGVKLERAHLETFSLAILTIRSQVAQLYLMEST